MAITEDARDSYDRDGDTSPVEMEAPIGDFSSSRTGDPRAVEDVLYSDIGINVLLSRLKQSIASAREFAAFLKKRSALEEDHAQGLKKLSKNTFDAARRPDVRGGSYAVQLADMSRAHERMADHGIQFALSLHQMHEDLSELSNNMDQRRKHWKQQGGNAEKRVKDAESLMEKAKARYDSLAEDYERARTGDRTGGRVFTVKGPKSAERHEEDLNRKLQAADADYASKVQGAQAARQENTATARPQAIKALQELIRESDAALTLQLQKFAAFSEKLLVGNGMIVSPLKDSTGGMVTGANASLREMAHQIDNDRDLQMYITSHSRNVPPRASEIRYEKHPTLAPSQQAPTQSTISQQAPTLQPIQSSQTMDFEDRSTTARQQPSLNTRTQPPTTSPITQSPRQPLTGATAGQGTPMVSTPNSPFANQQSSQQATPDRAYRGPSQEQYSSPVQPPQPQPTGLLPTQPNPTGPPTMQYQPPQQLPPQQYQNRDVASRPPQSGPPPQQYQPSSVPTQRYQAPIIPVAQAHQYQSSPTGPPNGSYPPSAPPYAARQQQQQQQQQPPPPQSQPQFQAQQQQQPTQRFAGPGAAAPASNGAYAMRDQQSVPQQQPVSQQPVPQQAVPQQPVPQQARVPQPQGQNPPAQGQKTLKPVFGVHLDTLFRRDESPVPMVVYQCIQAIDLFGLDTEGIYRLSGNAAHISQLKYLFDSGDSARIDFRNPENFHHDVNSVAGLLKQFFKDLPDPLLTTEFYNDFIEAARIDDDVMRRDSLHAVINSLPDPNYATLRALILHLNRVQEHSQANRMSTSNLAICLAPTIMGPHRGPQMADAGLQARVLDTMIQATYAIFDED